MSPKTNTTRFQIYFDLIRNWNAGPRLSTSERNFCKIYSISLFVSRFCFAIYEHNEYSLVRSWIWPVKSVRIGGRSSTVSLLFYESEMERDRVRGTENERETILDGRNIDCLSGFVFRTLDISSFARNVIRLSRFPLVFNPSDSLAPLAGKTARILYLFYAYVAVSVPDWLLPSREYRTR